MFVLRCNHSGTSYPATADQFLILGSAGHCQCLLSSAQQVEAVIVRYCEGWVIHELQGTGVKKNGVLVEQRAALEDGDTIELGGHALSVTGAGRSTPLDDPVVNRPCWISLTLPGRTEERHMAKAHTLLGTSLLSDILLPDGPACKTKHCLVAVSENNWYVIDLTGDGGLHNQRHWQGIVRVVNADTVQLGEVIIRFEMHQSSCRELRRPGSSSSDTDQLQARDTDVEDNLLQPMLGRRKTHVDSMSDPVAELAQGLLDKVRALHAVTVQPVGNFSALIRRYLVVPKLAAAERKFMAGYKETALHLMNKLLEDDPWDPQLLLSFARMCDAGQMHLLCLRVLSILQNLDREDADVRKSMARVCLVLAEDDPRYFSLSIQCWEKAAEQVPAEAGAIQSLVRDLSARQAIKQSNIL